MHHDFCAFRTQARHSLGLSAGARGSGWELRRGREAAGGGGALRRRVRLRRTRRGVWKRRARRSAARRSGPEELLYTRIGCQWDGKVTVRASDGMRLRVPARRGHRRTT
eukprot:1121316-Rhodomonas_salina.2